MVCFIRNISTWAHVAQCDVLSYNIPVFSTEDDIGTIRIEGEHPDYSMNWVILGGLIFYVESCSPSEGETDLTISRPMNAFDRSLVYTGTGSEQLESFMADAITENFIQQEDTEYAMPYLSVTYAGETEVEVAYIIGEVYPFLDIIDLAYEKDIRFIFIPSATELQLIIAPLGITVHNIFFNDGHNYLEEVNISNELVSKVTVRRVITTEDEVEVTETRNFYWHKGGDIDETPPDPRLKGLWRIVSIEDNDEETAPETIGKNICPPQRRWEEGYVNADGGISPPNQNQKEIASPYITIDAGETYTFSYRLTGTPSADYWRAICFYNASNAKIGDRTAGYTSDPVTATAPAGSAYARVSIRSYDMVDYVQLELGSTATEYEEYGADSQLMLDAAKEAMRDNNEAVKLTFYSDQELAMGDWIRCKINNELVSTQITSCVISSDDSRYLYSAGEMPTTLTDKFADEVYQRKEQAITNENADADYLLKSGGTVGEVAVKGTLTANGFVVGPESRGSTLPVAGEENGQIFFLVSS